MSLTYFNDACVGLKNAADLANDATAHDLVPIKGQTCF